MKEYKLIRVTSVLDYVESKWKEYWWRKVGFEAADKIGKESAAFGTSVHSLVESSLLDVAIPAETNEQLMCANSILNYLVENKIEPLFGTYDKSLEIEVSDKKLGLVGHFDYAAMIDGEPYIVDFKTSNQMRKSFPLQKAAYAKMANKKFKVKIDKGLTIRSHWNKETNAVDFEVKKYDNLMKKYWPIFNGCLDTYKYFTRKDEV